MDDSRKRGTLHFQQSLPLLAAGMPHCALHPFLIAPVLELLVPLSLWCHVGILLPASSLRLTAYLTYQIQHGSSWGTEMHRRVTLLVPCQEDLILSQV